MKLASTLVFALIVTFDESQRRETPVDCSGAVGKTSFTASYTPAAPGVSPAMLDVTLKFAMLDVVFSKAPDTQTIYRILVDELKKAVAKQSRKWPTTAFAKTGSRSNPASHQQIRGTSTHFINVEFDPKTGRITDEQGRVIR